MILATSNRNSASRPAGTETRMADRKRLPNGEPNMSPSGALPDPVVQEPGIIPLKAIHQIGYGQQRVATPGSLFMPANAVERAELLQGEYPPAEEPSTAELLMWSDAESEFA